MYKFELINNHYIINIEGYRYLLDTGSPDSFRINPDCDEVIIDGVAWSLNRLPHNLDVDKVKKLVGTDVDGFIGLDIVKRTSLTIYKNGLIDFNVNDVDGMVVRLNTHFFLTLWASNGPITGEYIIDTGAKYGYGDRDIFNGLFPFNHVKDYNPILGNLESDIYHVTIDIDGLEREVDVCDNDKVMSTLPITFMIGNITTLFDEACVFDIKNNRLILK